MTLEWFRDLVIVIFGIGATLVVLAFLVMSLILFFRVKAVMDSAKEISMTARDITRCVKEEIIKPLAQIAALFQGIRQAAGMFGGFGRKKGGD